MSSEVTVVIPVRDDAAGLPDAVASLLAQSAADQLEILLCVGPSSDATDRVAHELALAHDQVSVVANPHGGIPQALNLGLRHATGSVLVRVDARCVLPNDYVHRAITTLRRTRAANVGARQHPVGHTPTQRGIAAAMRHRLGSGGASYRHGGEPRRVDTAFLGVFDVEHLRLAGGWDERFARNEDAELNVRLSHRGEGVWLDPALVVAYQPRRDLAGLWRQYRDYGWWRRQTVALHPESLSPRQLAAPVISIGLVGSSVVAMVAPAAILVPAAYGAVLTAAAATAADLDLRERATMVAALAVMHLAWGSGFLQASVERLAPMSRASAVASVQA